MITMLANQLYYKHISTSDILIHGSHTQGNIIFQDISRTKLPFSRTNYTRFKGNKSRHLCKSISYLVNGWWIIDIFMVQPHSHPSICLIYPLLFKFKLTWDIKTMYRCSFPSIIEVFFHRHNIYSQAFLF